MEPHESKGIGDRHLWEIASVRDVLWIGVALAGLVVIHQLRSIFTPVLIALGLAYLFDPLITYAEKRAGMPRPLTITLILFVLGLAAAGFAAWLAPVLIVQIVGLVEKLAGYTQRLADRYEIKIGDLHTQVAGLVDRLRQNPRSMLQDVFAGTGQAFGVIGSVVGSTTYVVLTLMVMPFYFFFFAWRLRSVGALVSYIPESKPQNVLRILGRMEAAVGSYFRGRMIICLILGIALSAGWWAVGVPYWFLLGMITGALNLVPYASILTLPVALLLKYLETTTVEGASDFPWLGVFLWPSVVYFFVQFLDGWVLTPWIQGKSLNMGSVTILLVVLVGGAVGGLLGLLLAVPLAACAKIVFEEVFRPRLEAQSRSQ